MAETPPLSGLVLPRGVERGGTHWRRAGNDCDVRPGRNGFQREADDAPVSCESARRAGSAHNDLGKARRAAGHCVWHPSTAWPAMPDTGPRRVMAVGAGRHRFGGIGSAGVWANAGGPMAPDILGSSHQAIGRGVAGRPAVRLVSMTWVSSTTSAGSNYRCLRLPRQFGRGDATSVSGLGNISSHLPDHLLVRSLSARADSGQAFRRGLWPASISNAALTSFCQSRNFSSWY